MDINIKVIPHSQQRYKTVGDWWWTLHTLEIRVSKLNNEFKETCVAVHELVEAFLCQLRGVSEKEVTDFDVLYEKNREAGDESEPGDHPRAPYKREHCFATGIERLLVSAFELDWRTYEETINSL